MVTFGLNALYGRTISSDGSVTGPWNSTNAEALLRYTVNRGYMIHGWELGKNKLLILLILTDMIALKAVDLRFFLSGNELSGKGIGARIGAKQYASDLQDLRDIVDKIYKGLDEKPLILAPGGFYDFNWFDEFIRLTNRTLQVVTQHVYNLGPGTTFTPLKHRVSLRVRNRNYSA